MTTQAQIGPKTNIRASAALSASGAWAELTTPVWVAKARRVILIMTYTGGGSASGAYPQMWPVISFEATAPAIGDDTWFSLPAPDPAYTAVSLASGTLPSGWDQTSIASSFGSISHAPLILIPKPTTAASEKVRETFYLDIAGANWLQVLSHEAGDASHPGTLALDIVTVS